MKEERFKPFAAVYLVLRQGNKVLLSIRKNTGFCDGQHGLVAGHFDGGETARQAMMREAKEEAGIKINPADLNVVLTMHSINPEKEYFNVFLVADKWQGEITNMEPDKCSGLEFFDSDNLPPSIIPYVAEALRLIKEGVTYTEYGFETPNIIESK